jgi:hypothetical protein
MKTLSIGIVKKESHFSLLNVRSILGYYDIVMA